nr:ImmA/IrrE family metallo-endopeptidase [Nostoc sp. EkiNYC01]
MPSRSKQAALKILKNYGFSIPVDIEFIATSEGLSIRKQELEDDVSGLLVIKDDQVVIGINSKHHINRQRFTIAHEFGHYLLHSQLAKIFFDESTVFFRDKEASEGIKYQEIEANQFAAELLMPELILREKIVQQPLDAFDEAAIKQLANEFEVSVQALTIRLTKLGLITV